MFCSKVTSMTRVEVFQYCCSLGMTLLKEDSLANLKAIVKWHSTLGRLEIVN